MENTKNNLTSDELRKLKLQALEILSNDRHDILMSYGFIGGIAMRMDLVPVRDFRVRTACTDGNRIFFDLDFMSKLNKKERVFVLAHEIWHSVMLHLVRRQTRDMFLFNIATDKEVNYMLKQDGFTSPPDLCFPEGDEIGKSAEEIYELMLKKMNKQQNNENSGKKLFGQFDKHIYKDTDNMNDENENTNVEDTWGEVGVDEDFTPMISNDFADKMKEAVIAEAQKQERLRGNLPNHISSLVKKMLTPEIKWEEHLAQFVTRFYNSGKRTWLPPNRRHIYSGTYLQSRRDEKLKVGVGIDTSGSCLRDLSKFLTELVSLLNTFGKYELHLIQGDLKVDKYEFFDNDNPLIVENGGFEFKGGGGTDAKPIFDYVVENNLDIDVFIMFTDGYTTTHDKNPLGIPVLWILTKDGYEDFCDWGEKLKFKNN